MLHEPTQSHEPGCHTSERVSMMNVIIWDHVMLITT